MTVPTKGANSSSTKTRTEQLDAFSYYSNDSVRMKRLLMKEDDETVGADSRQAVSDVSASGNEDSNDASSDRSREPDAKPIQEGTRRKTRISFEVHPSLLLDELEDALYPEEMADVPLRGFDDLLLNLIMSEPMQQVSGIERSDLEKR